jgi:hypothetical protein
VRERERERERKSIERIPHRSVINCLFCNKFARPEHSQDMQFTRRAAYSRTTGAVIGAKRVASILRGAEASHARKSCAIYLDKIILKMAN